MQTVNNSSTREEAAVHVKKEMNQRYNIYIYREEIKVVRWTMRDSCPPSFTTAIIPKRTQFIVVRLWCSTHIKCKEWAWGGGDLNTPSAAIATSETRLAVLDGSWLLTDRNVSQLFNLLNFLIICCHEHITMTRPQKARYMVGLAAAAIARTVQTTRGRKREGGGHQHGQSFK